MRVMPPQYALPLEQCRPRACPTDAPHPHLELCDIAGRGAPSLRRAPAVHKNRWPQQQSGCRRRAAQDMPSR